MTNQIVTFLLNLLIAAAVILFSLSLSYVIGIMLFKLAVTSGEINSALITMFVSGVVASISISVKALFNKDNDVKGYIFVGKTAAILVGVMLIVRYFTLIS